MVIGEQVGKLGELGMFIARNSKNQDDSLDDVAGRFLKGAMTRHSETWGEEKRKLRIELSSGLGLDPESEWEYHTTCTEEHWESFCEERFKSFPFRNAFLATQELATGWVAVVILSPSAYPARNRVQTLLELHEGPGVPRELREERACCAGGE